MSAPTKTAVTTACDLATAKSEREVTSIALSYAKDSIAPIMDTIKELSDFNSDDVSHLRSRLELLRSLAKVGSILVFDMVNDMEVQHEQACDKIVALAGGAA